MVSLPLHMRLPLKGNVNTCNTGSNGTNLRWYALCLPPWLPSPVLRSFSFHPRTVPSRGAQSYAPFLPSDADAPPQHQSGGAPLRAHPMVPVPILGESSVHLLVYTMPGSLTKWTSHGDDVSFKWPLHYIPSTLVDDEWCLAMILCVLVRLWDHPCWRIWNTLEYSICQLH